MRASEILRKLADVIDSADNQSTMGQSPDSPNKAELTAVSVDHKDDTDKTTMVPPLQQKIEILKKSVGVDNEFDQGFDQIDAEQKPDELEVLKKAAGIHTVHDDASDEPLDQ